MTQSRAVSFIEAAAQTLIGYVISLGVQLVVYPLFGATFSFMDNIYIGLIFLVVSFVRQYIIRRWFNAQIHAISLKLSGEQQS